MAVVPVDGADGIADCVIQTARVSDGGLIGSQLPSGLRCAVMGSIGTDKIGMPWGESTVTLVGAAGALVCLRDFTVLRAGGAGRPGAARGPAWTCDVDPDRPAPGDASGAEG